LIDHGALNNMKKRLIALAATLLFPAASHASLFDAVTLSAGWSDDFDTPFRIGLRGDTDYRWFDSGTGYLSAYYELALSRFTDSERPATSISLSPVLTYNFRTSGKLEPFVELGIGLTWISENKVGSRDLGSRFQFEDRIGAGFRTGDHDWTLRYIHYSNAGFEEPNDGLDLVMLNYGYRF
jgi:lipid A 3-O-deacylase